MFRFDSLLETLSDKGKSKKKKKKVWSGVTGFNFKIIFYIFTVFMKVSLTPEITAYWKTFVILISNSIT